MTGRSGLGVVLNPVARDAGPVRDLLHSVCRERGVGAPVVLTTSVARPGAAQARELVDRGVARVVVAGGDGTVREVAGVLAGTPTPMGIVPLGTANLFARNLGLPLGGSERAVHVAVAGPVHEVDVGRVSYRQFGPVGPVTSPDLVFLVVVGLGYDGETVAGTAPVLKRVAGWTAYFVVGSRHLARPLHRLTVRLDDEQPREVRAWSVLVGSTGRIPLGIDLFPDARPDDGRLHVVTVAPRTALHWAPIALRGLLHRPGQVPGLRHDRAQRVRVVADRPLTAQLDGDAHANVLGMDVRVRPAALRVAVPGATPRS